MKKLLVMAAMVLSSVGAFAQYSAGDITIQPKVGLSLAKFTKTDNANTRAGVVGGAEFEYHVSPLVGISAGVLYSQQGCKFDSEAEAKGVKVKYTETYKNDYLNIPILANFYVAEGLAIKAGVQPGFKVSSKYTEEITGGGESATLNKDVEGVKSFDLAIPVGISYEFANICLDARYNWGVTKITDAENSGKNSVFQVTVGYKFKL